MHFLIAVEARKCGCHLWSTFMSLKCRPECFEIESKGGAGMSSKSEYVPGVCNIGFPEIKMRKTTGWLALGFTIIPGIALYFLPVPAGWRLLLFIPATISAIGFLQAYMHFCVAYGWMGVFNLGSKIGRKETVEQAEFRRKDRQKALRIIFYSILSGIIVAGTAYNV